MNKPLGRFVEGSIWRHVTTMSLTNAVGLTMIFLVDFINIFFISLLGVTELAAGIGFAGTVLFFVRATAVALGIATSVLVSRHLGANQLVQVRRYVMNSTLLSVLLVAVLATVVFIFRVPLLSLIGAKGETLHYAADFLAIVLPATPLLTLGMCGGQIIRAYGEARLSMWISISTAVLNLLLDPLFIFALGMGLQGAAWATVLSQLFMMLITWRFIIFRFRLAAPLRGQAWLADIPAVFAIAGPAMLTNIASPISAAFASSQMAKFGDEAVAAFAVTMRLVPVTLAVIFALSGAIAPIVGQNAGAGQFPRVRETMRVALQFNWLTVVLVALILFALQNVLPYWFSLSGEGAALLVFFCGGAALLFGFDGMIFSVNAAFNNLGRPLHSTLNNLARVFLGAMPLVWLGQHYFGARGVLLGYMAESIWVAPLSWLIMQRLVARYERGELVLGRVRERDRRRSVALWPFSKRWP